MGKTFKCNFNDWVDSKWNLFIKDLPHISTNSVWATLAVRNYRTFYRPCLRRTTAKVLGRTDCHHSLDECIGCGACAEICPVNAVAMDDDDRPVVDMDWCIGCGVCMVSCPADVIAMNNKKGL